MSIFRLVMMMLVVKGRESREGRREWRCVLLLGVVVGVVLLRDGCYSAAVVLPMRILLGESTRRQR